jgi:hypothetical protein
MRILPLSSWNETGALKNLRRVPSEAEVIALDPSDAERHGLKTGRERLHFLYGNLPVPQEKRSSLQFDPSALPFLSQRLLIVVSSLQPENYTFYQRRLAEFQSRMESTLEVGRSQIQGIKMLDLTGAASSWVRAAALEAVRPPEYLWTAWARGERTRELTLAVSEAVKRGWWIVIDTWTPRRILISTDGASKIVHITPPENDKDFFVYLHDIYLQMWNATVKK